MQRFAIITNLFNNPNFQTSLFFLHTIKKISNYFRSKIGQYGPYMAFLKKLCKILSFFFDKHLTRIERFRTFVM